MILDEAYVVSTAWFLQQRVFEFCLHAGVCQAARPSLQRPAAGLCMRSVVPGVRGKTKATCSRDTHCIMSFQTNWRPVRNHNENLVEWRMEWLLAFTVKAPVLGPWLEESLAGITQMANWTALWKFARLTPRWLAANIIFCDWFSEQAVFRQDGLSDHRVSCYVHVCVVCNPLLCVHSAGATEAWHQEPDPAARGEGPRGMLGQNVWKGEWGKNANAFQRLSNAFKRFPNGFERVLVFFSIPLFIRKATY